MEVGCIWVLACWSDRHWERLASPKTKEFQAFPQSVAVAVVTDAGTGTNIRTASLPCVGCEQRCVPGWEAVGLSLSDVTFLNVGVCQNCPMMSLKLLSPSPFLLFPPLSRHLFFLLGGRVLSVYREMQLRYQSGCFPRESIQRVRRTEELSLASVDHWCTSSWAFNSLPAWVLREILGKSQQGCSLNGRRSLQRWMKDTLALLGFFYVVGIFHSMYFGI